MTTSCLPRAFRFLAIAVLALTALGLRAASPATFDIPAQPAPAALKQFIKQSGAQVVYIQDDLKAVTTKAVKGELAPADALAQLLDGTGFSIETMANGNFTISRQVAVKPGSIEGTIRDNESSRPVAGARVIIAGTDISVVTDKRGRFTFAEAPAGEHTLEIFADGIQNTKVTDVSVKTGHRLTLSTISVPVKTAGAVELEPYIVSAKKNDGVIELDPYSVEGRKEKPFVANMDIARTINDAQPYYMFDAKTLEQSGAVTVEDFLKQRLTMNTTIQSYAEVSGLTTLGNTSRINLRGLGTDKTLLLINGRRMAGVSTNSNVDGQPDLNGIPLGAIERIEVLPSSASGIYGGSAIGGVVNVILKQNYTGGELRLSYDTYLVGDAGQKRASLNYGISLNGGKTKLMLSASWSDTSPLLLQDGVDIYRRNVDLLQANSPTFFFSSTSAWLGSLPNITATPASLATLTLRDGRSLNSRITYVPAGTAPNTTPTELAAGLLANAGKWIVDYPASTQAPSGLLRPIGSPTESRSFRVGLRQQILPRLEVTADFSHNENRTASIFNSITTLLVSPTVPTNPFTSFVSLRPPDARSVPTSTNSQGQSATIGLLAELPWNWTGNLDYTWSKNQFNYQYYNQDSSAISADLLSGVLNPFVDTLQYPLDWNKYLYTIAYEGLSEVHDFAVRASGPLPMLPWGQPSLAVGIERNIQRTPERTQTVDYPISVANSMVQKYYTRESTIDTGYAEMTLPLLENDWLPGIHSLELQLSGRSDRYSVDTGTNYEMTFYKRTPPLVIYNGPTLNGQPYFSEASYTTTNYTLGLKYQPVAEVTFRASRAAAFLPPTPTQLLKNPVQSTTTTNVLDPVTSQQTAVFTLSGGNPDLRPQNSVSSNVGVIWEPTWKPLRGLRLNAEYYKIEQYDAIGTLSAQAIVNQEGMFPGRVTRDGSGRITLVDSSMVNLYHRVTEGLDLSAAYSMKTPMGNFRLDAIQTIILHLKNQYSQTQPEYDAVRFPSEDGAAKYKANVTLTWDWRGWNTGWTARYFGSYKQAGAAGGPSSMQFAGGDVYDSSYITAGGGDTIPSQIYHDLFVRYSFRMEKREGGASNLQTLSSKLLDGLSIQFNVRNVFDKVAPLDPYYSSSYYLSPYGGGLAGMRSYLVTVTKQF